MEIPQLKNNFHCEKPIDLFFGKDHLGRPIAVAMQENNRGKFGMIFDYDVKGRPVTKEAAGGEARCPEKTKLHTKDGKLVFVDRHDPRKGEDFTSYILHGPAGSQRTFPMQKAARTCLRGELGTRIGEASPKHGFRP
ncbi:MAG: hypothetical protein WCX64_03535 [Candidatus Micrarchaeia archaeon]|jgi:hypothetical protein